MKKHTVEELNKLFQDGESCDQAHFAEQRTNTLLYIGEHWKKASRELRKSRQAEGFSETTKIQLTENHIAAVCDEYQSNIVNIAPGATTQAANENELADQKDAELSLAVMQDGERRVAFDEKVEEWSADFIQRGECFSFTWWNPSGGELKGYNQKVDESGQPLFLHPELGEIPSQFGLTGEALNPAPDESDPVFEGDLEVDVIFPPNVIRKKGAESIEQSPFLCIRKMVVQDDAIKMFGAKEGDEVFEAIKKSCEQTYKVFNTTTGAYEDSQDEALFKYWFWRKCPAMPKGYFYVQVGDLIVAEGELPYGVFPIAYAGFRKIATSPRAKSIIKDLRHPQLELNRLVSRRALHSIVLGDDKIITTSGGKLQKGSTWAGIREFTSAGGANSVSFLQGRDGSQFEASINHQVQTIYKLAKLDLILQDRQSVQDPNAQLFMSLRQRAKFTPFAGKFGRFIVKTWEIYLELAKNYFQEDRVIQATGKREAINIAEFKSVQNMRSRIKVKPATTDLESMMGQQLNLTTLLQYVGKDLPKNVLGRVIRQLPFLNEKQIADEFTLTDENIDSDILALDRGTYRPPRKGDDHAQFIKRLEARTRQSDYELLSPLSKQMYEQRIAQQEAMAAEQAAQLKAQEAEFIPTGGALVTCSLHLPDPERPGQTRQARVPYEALMKLIKMLETQGMGQEQLEQMNQHNQIQVLQQANQQMGARPAVGMQQPPGMPPMTA